MHRRKIIPMRFDSRSYKQFDIFPTFHRQMMPNASASESHEEDLSPERVTACHSMCFQPDSEAPLAHGAEVLKRRFHPSKSFDFAASYGLKDGP